MLHQSACYGRMYPPTLLRTANEHVKGKVFGYRVEHTGMVAQGQTVTTDQDAWRDCVKCPDLDGCFRLSTGTLLMEVALTR